MPWPTTSNTSFGSPGFGCRIVAIFAVISVVTCGLVVVLYGLLRGNWLEGVLAGITLAMANIPEEFPVVLTVFLVLGAWRMVRHRALVRRPPAIEACSPLRVQSSRSPSKR